MASHEDVAERWLDTLCGRTDRRGRPLENFSSRSQSMYGEGNALYSYGRHFPLAEYYPAGRYRRRALFLLNGDRVSNTTARHQNVTRGAVARAISGVRAMPADMILLPFSALDAARIVRSSIRPLEVRSDTWLDVEESADRLEDVPDRYASSREYRTADRIEDVPADVSARGWSDRYSHDRPYMSDGRYHWTETVWLEPAADGRYHWTRSVHRLGDSLFTAETQVTVRHRRHWTVADVIAETLELISADNYQARQTSLDVSGRRRRYGLEGTDRLPTTVGRRLESLELEPIETAHTVARRRRYVSSFDMNEPQPAYFLATLPAASRARTVDMAIEDLAPAAVHAAIARGRDVRRQGDIFFIGTELEDADVYGSAVSRARLTQWTRGAVAKVGETGYLEPITAGRWSRIKRERRRMYLQRRATLEHMRRPGPADGTYKRGIRRQTARDRASYERSMAAYRLECRSAILRADMAALRIARGRFSYVVDRGPANARLAARDKYRETSIAGFGVARGAWSDTFGVAYGRYSGRPTSEEARRRLRGALTVHGTAHSATEVVHATGGRVYVRGIVRHVPELIGENRGRDHVNVRLEPGRWYLAIRNTVPRNRDTAGR